MPRSFFRVWRLVITLPLLLLLSERFRQLAILLVFFSCDRYYIPTLLHFPTLDERYRPAADVRWLSSCYHCNDSFRVTTARVTLVVQDRNDFMNSVWFFGNSEELPESCEMTFNLVSNFVFTKWRNSHGRFVVTTANKSKNIHNSCWLTNGMNLSKDVQTCKAFTDLGKQ